MWVTHCLFRLSAVLFRLYAGDFGSLSKSSGQSLLCNDHCAVCKTIGAYVFEFHAFVLLTPPSVFTFMTLLALPRLAERENTFWGYSLHPMFFTSNDPDQILSIFWCSFLSLLPSLTSISLSFLSNEIMDVPGRSEQASCCSPKSPDAAVYFYMQIILFFPSLLLWYYSLSRHVYKYLSRF